MIDSLTQKLAAHSTDINDWIREHTRNLPLPFYASADIRDSGVKAACVDLNIFPAGFNNICNNLALRAVAPVREYLCHYFGERSFSRVLIVPEAHTRNPFYNSNLSRLQALVEAAGLSVDIAAMPTEDGAVTHALLTAEEEEIHLTQVQRHDDTLCDETGTPYDWILLNNDLSAGPLPFIENITQPVLPPACLGWHKRKKSLFYSCLEKCITAFATTFDFDPWLLLPYTIQVENVDFTCDDDRERVADAVDQIQQKVRKKYTEYAANEVSTVFVKNDAGTYGIGIMVVDDPNEVRTMNRKAKNKMAVGKGNIRIRDVVVQEGVRTRTITQGSVSEEVIYLIGQHVIGAFLRANPQRDDSDNLNARGMEFFQYCDLIPATQHGACMCTRESQFVYYLLAQLSVVAAAHETTYLCPKMTPTL